MSIQQSNCLVLTPHPLTLYNQNFKVVASLPSNGTALIGSKNDQETKPSPQESSRINLTINGTEVQVNLKEQRKLGKDLIVTTKIDPQTGEKYDPEKFDTVFVSMVTGLFLKKNTHVFPQWKTVIGPDFSEQGSVRKDEKTGELSGSTGTVIGTRDLVYYRIPENFNGKLEL
jgi:hypothetical protein